MSAATQEDEALRRAREADARRAAAKSGGAR